MRGGDPGPWLEASYERDYHRNRHGRLLDDAFYYELKAREAKETLFKHVGADAEVFEFGFGTGKNIALLPRKSGYDVSEFARAAARERGVQVFDDMEGVPDESYDVVLSSHVLEHLEDPATNLKLLRSKLKPAGTLVVVLPVEPHRRVPFEIDVDQHLFSWNFRTINNLLQRNGFRVLENRYRYGTAQYKLRHLAKVSYRLYEANVRLIGRVLGRRDMIVIAEKR